MVSDNLTTEQYIIDENQEINLGERPEFLRKFFKAFPALRHRNYKLYFFGQLVSLIGTWLQIVASGWLVLQLTQSAFLVGLVAGIGSLPVLLFSLFGGVIVDRFDKKKIIIFTQIALMLLALTLGILTVFNVITVPEIILISFLSGLVTAVDMPARQTFMIEIVGKDDLPSAIALNSGLWNGARAVGPAFAGILIELVGLGGAFIINGISFMTTIIALYYIQTKVALPKIHPHPLKAIKEGIVYAFSHQVIKNLLIFAGISSIFGWSYTTIMPVVVEHVYHAGAAVLGYFYSIVGIGALFAALIVSAFSKKIKPLFFILGGSMLFAITIMLFSLTTNYTLAYPLLFLAGFGLIGQFSMINTTIQHMVDDSLRGRVMSLYTLMFNGMMPAGSFQIGLMSEYFGPSLALFTNGAVILIFSVYFFTIRNKANLLRHT